MTTLDEPAPAAAETEPRYCAACGEIATVAAPRCPHCGREWQWLSIGKTPSLVALLTELADLRGQRVIGPDCYAALRRVYEHRLVAARPHRYAAVSHAPARARQPAAVRPPSPPSPPLLPQLAAWTAARQADILLYLGAFLLSIAALIFVGYQGGALTGPVRFAILVGYTLAFLALGFRLPRWARVREAGSVFLALGALLVPVNFVALRTQALGGSNVPLSVIWFAGASVTAALYLTLALRGFGRLYAFPGAVAVLVAWGSLAAIGDLPVAWYGAWYAGGAVLIDRAVAWLALPPHLRLGLAAELVAVCALATAHLVAALREGEHGQLSATYGVLSAALIAAFVGRRSARATLRSLALLPAFLSLTALTALWAAFALDPVWYGCFVIAAGIGYLAVARLADPARAVLWERIGAGAAALALALVHGRLSGGGGGRPAALPLTYAGALAGAAVVYTGRQRRAALALIPPLAAALGMTTLWTLRLAGLEWVGASVAVAGLGYLFACELDRAEAENWRMAAATAGMLALAVAHVAALAPGAAAWQLPLTYAIVLTGAALSYLREPRREALAPLPLLGAGLGIAAMWAVRAATLEWIGAWLALAAVGYALAGEVERADLRLWRSLAAGVGGAALLAAHVAAPLRDTAVWQLPVTYAILLAGAAWDGRRRQDAALALLPALGAALADALLWALGVGSAWWAYPGLAAVLLTLVAEPWWRRLPQPRALGWPLMFVAAPAIPLLFTGDYVARPGNGMAAVAAAALLLLAIGWRARGALAAAFAFSASPSAADRERQVASLLAADYLFVAAAYGNALAGLRGDDRAWLFVGLGLGAWAGLALAGRVWRGLFLVLAPPAIGALAIAALLSVADGQRAVVLALGAGGTAAAFPVTRRWLLWDVAALFGAFALGDAWVTWGWRMADLPLAYAAIGAVLWAGLTPRRDYRSDERGATVTALSFAPAALAVAVGVVLTARRADALTATETLVRTREWATLTLAAAAGSTLVIAEGARLGRRLVWIPGTAGLLLAGLLGIGVTQPANVQAYTIPVGLYLVALGFSFRRSEQVLGHQMLAHEAVTSVGLLWLALPPAWQSFAPNGSRYGLELIVMGLLFLAVGIVAYARWTVAGGVLTLSGVAVRWLAEYSASAPRWLILGIIGTALIGAGLLLLLQRDRWDGLRRRIARWWTEGEPGAGPPRTPGGALPGGPSLSVP